jgi:hypothetical protein
VRPVTADEAREQLEAELWRIGIAAAPTVADIDRVLAAADFYAEQYADEQAAWAEGRERLTIAAAETGRKANGALG